MNKWRAGNLIKYGLTNDTYAIRLREQGGVCAVCKEPAPFGEYLPVDHKHGTKIVRGLLCHRCNKVLGMVRDSTDLLYALASYLLKNNS